MDGRISQVTLVVTDAARSLAFYVDQVGFEKKTDVATPAGYRWVTVGPRGQDLELALWQEGSATDPEQRAWSKNWGPAKAPPIVLRVSDCRKVYEELRGRGVEFVQVPKEYPWGIAATFRDPDGNLFSLSQPPAGWPPA
ncbi:MAG TPA: VOC family protein [Thermoplasmata archaeon]|nr:VOC family protein [Thermoplasmata archaeon]